MPARRAQQTRQPALVGAAIFSMMPHVLADFYEQVAGISFEHRVHDDGREHFVAQLAAVHVEIKALVRADGTPTPDAAGSAGTGSSRIELSFTVNDTTAAVARAIELGAAVNEAPVSHDWGTFATIIDPDGNRVGLYTPPPPSSTRGASL